MVGKKRKRLPSALSARERGVRVGSNANSSATIVKDFEVDHSGIESAPERKRRGDRRSKVTRETKKENKTKKESNKTR